MNEHKGQHFYIIGITLVATLGGLLFGYDTAVISGAVDALKSYFQLNEANYGTLATFYHGATVSSALIGCIIGSMVSGIFASYFGRKKSLLIAAVFFFISAIGSGFPEMLFVNSETELATLLIYFNAYRILGGIGVGLASAICPMYIAEMAPAEIRGKLVSWNQFAIIFGMLVVYFVNYFITKDRAIEWINVTGWRYMFASESIVAGLFGVLLFFVPETPRYLALIEQDEKALGILTKINGTIKAKQILKDIKNTAHEKIEKVTAYGWKVLIIGVLLSVFQQVVGINVVLYYAPTIFKGLGFGNDAAMWQTVIMGIVNILFTLVAIFTVDKFGRKPLLIIGSIGMAIGMFAIGLLAYWQIIGISTLIFIVIYSASFMMSWGPICWVLISEIFPNTIRGKAVAIAVAAQWITNFIVSATFPSLEAFSISFTYTLYGVMSVLSILFVWKMVPETKGKTLEEMAVLWKK
ncbi:MAG: D-xylose transporter XylE [Paludibacteraceae bacterium]|nr:D-xylose transporter XylE [Paludibacteraceae bacterium]MBN2786848.1 D-xylose transporter XylE [Paludibacteraceae bacterium]